MKPRRSRFHYGAPPLGEGSVLAEGFGSFLVLRNYASVVLRAECIGTHTPVMTRLPYVCPEKRSIGVNTRNLKVCLHIGSLITVHLIFSTLVLWRTVL
jgi:hypothetical protein